jgi:Zinc-binding domain of primase-helicase
MAKTRDGAERKGREDDWWAGLMAQCRGRWREILVKLGMPPSFLSWKDCPCPICGGRDRFIFSDKNGEGTWYCRGCGGDGGIGSGGSGGFKLAMRFRNTSVDETRELIEGIVGAAAPREPPKPKRAAYDGPASMPDPCERFESDAWAGLPLASRRMLDVIETAWFRDGGRSAWLVVTFNQFEACGVDRSTIQRARRDLLKRGLIDWKAGGRDSATKHQEPSRWRLTYAPMAGAEPSDKWRAYQASETGPQKCHSGSQNGSKAPSDDFANDSSTVSMSDNTGNATFGEGAAKVPLGGGRVSATVKSQRLVESVLQKESQSFFPDSTEVTPVSAVAADPVASIHSDPMSASFDAKVGVGTAEDRERGEGCAPPSCGAERRPT